MNKTAAIEWLRVAYHDLKSAQILNEAKHYTDSIRVDLQQALEKTPKTHDLYEVYILVEKKLKLSEDEPEKI